MATIKNKKDSGTSAAAAQAFGASEKMGVSEIVEFAHAVHSLENLILSATVGEGDEFLEKFVTFIEKFMVPLNFCRLDRGMLVDHALWRIVNAGSEAREAAITLASFLDPRQMAVQQAQLVTVLGRYAQKDQAVKAFLEDVADGSGMGLIGLNRIAVSKAEECLARDDNGREPPSQTDDLRML